MSNAQALYTMKNPVKIGDMCVDFYSYELRECRVLQHEARGASERSSKTTQKHLFLSERDASSGSPKMLSFSGFKRTELIKPD